jgi:uncharacterized repeat protein (TIGR01451 family)
MGESTWRIAMLAPGETKTIDMEGMVEQEGQVRACMAVTYKPAMCVVTDVVEPDLVVQRRMNRELAYVCDDLEVVYMIENRGSGTARGATLVEELPDGVMTAQGQSKVELQLEPIPAGERVERRVTLSADQPGTFSSYAMLAADARDARTRETEYSFVRPSLELEVDGPAREFVGRDVPLSIAVTNTSDYPAMETVLSIPSASDLPQVSLSTQQASMSGGEIRIGRLDAGETREFTLMFAAEQPRDHSIEVFADAYCAAEVSQTVNVQIDGVEAVRLETIDLTDPVTVGGETTYEIQVKNQGTAEAINVRVTAKLPSEMTFVGGQGDSEVRGDDRQIRLAAIPRLRPGDVASWRVRVRAEEPGKTRLRLELMSDATKRPVIEQEPTTIVDKPANVGGQR